MFLRVSVCPQGGGVVADREVHGYQGGHAWLLMGGHVWLPGGHAWLLAGGACMVAGGGACLVAGRGVCVVAGGGHMWQRGTMHGEGGACVGYDIRRYDQ